MINNNEQWPMHEVETDTDEYINEMMNDNEFDELSHMLNDINCNEEDTTTIFDEPFDTDTTPNSCDEIIADAIEQLKNPNTEITIQNMACAAHTLQLAILDAFKLWPDSNELIIKCVDIVKAVRTPNIRRLLKDRRMIVPGLNVVTRWNSIYLMVI